MIKEIGSDALFSLLALKETLGDPYDSRIQAFYEQCRDGDLAFASLRPISKEIDR